MKSDKPYLEQTIIVYNEHYGDSRVCKCGHRYYRHFDGYEGNAPVGCKYCPCRTFEEAALDARPLALTKEDIEHNSTPFLGMVHMDSAHGSETIGVIFPMEYVEELGNSAARLKMQVSEFPGLEHHIELFDTFIAISKEARGE